MLNQKCEQNCDQDDYTHASLNVPLDFPTVFEIAHVKHILCPDGRESGCQSTFCICRKENPEYDEQDDCESDVDNDYFNCIIRCGGNNA